MNKVEICGVNTAKLPTLSKKHKDELFIKEPVNELGKKIAIKEIEWYKHIKTLNYKNIPEIFDYSPLRMKLIDDLNIHENRSLTLTEKKEILTKTIKALDNLHNLEKEQAVVIEDCEETYLRKTFEYRKNISGKFSVVIK